MTINHIWRAWNCRRNHRSGLPMLALTVLTRRHRLRTVLFLIRDNAAWLPLLHWIAGLALPLLYLLGLHIRLVRPRALPASITRSSVMPSPRRTIRQPV